MRPEYFFISDCDGSLHDTRRENWAANPLRPGYTWTHRNIHNGKELRATLRSGPYAWPGGYEMALHTSDGEALCWQCARAELRNILWSIRHEVNDGWRVVACDIEHEGTNCDHCGRRIGPEEGE